MEIGIIGRSEYTYETMLLLKENGHNISFIVTSKESKEHKYSSNDFKKFANDNNIPFLHDPKIDLAKIKALLGPNNKPQICISVNYTSIISKEVVELFELGILNAHGGDLPRYRGNACQAWAIINGEEKIGLCIHKMLGGELDSGDIISKAYFSVNINTRIGEVYEWMQAEIPNLMYESLKKISNLSFIPEKQSKNHKDALRTYPRNPNDGKIDWSKDAESIIRLINASSEPFAGAFTNYIGKKIVIWRACLFNDKEKYYAIPGQISRINKDSGNIVVITGKGKIEIQEIELNNNRGKPTDFIKSIRSRLT